MSLLTLSFTLLLLEMTGLLPKVRQMMNEAGYIDYIREQSQRLRKRKVSSNNIENCLVVFKT